MEHGADPGGAGRPAVDGRRAPLDATDQRQIGDNRDGKTPFAVDRGRWLAVARIRRSAGRTLEAQLGLRPDAAASCCDWPRRGLWDPGKPPQAQSGRRRLWQTISGALGSVGARDGNREHTEVVGEFLAVPVIGPQLVATVKRMLAEDASLARLRPRTAWRCVVAVGRHRRRTQRRVLRSRAPAVRNPFDPVETEHRPRLAAPR